MSESRLRMEFSHLATYEELKAFAAEHSHEMTAAERWGIMERMRQVRFGYEPGTLKMDKVIRQYDTMEDFRAATEREYEEEIRKFGPR